jgi:dolichol-phosphate mannosyltransferase
MGFKTASVEVENDPRYEGTSSYTLKKLIKLALDAVIAFSDKPLRLSIQFGFLISLISFLYGSYIFFSALVFGTSLSGWSSLMVSVYFLGGIIITILGILGTYLGKVYDETKNRPLYIIDKKTFD